MWQEFRSIIQRIVHLRDTTDVKGTIDSIRKSIAIRGYNVWILACGAMLASIGLDTNSPAVIIGAMLISPLMSPILGIGLSVGINDREHLILALENFAIAVIAVLGVSTIYFWATPLGAPTAEITARTYPTILDVLVAIFGGIAGIVAGSRKEKTNAIPGVAIATALMPPLCVAGYGIARGRWDFFGGAAYLFFINSVFIALSTYIIVRFLRFPYVDYIDEKARKRAARWIAAFAIVVIIPSAFFMIKVIQRFNRDQNTERFISEVVNNNNHRAVDYDFDAKEPNRLNLYMTGAYLSEDSVSYLTTRLADYQLAECNLHFVQNLPPLDQNELQSQMKLEILKEIQPALNFKQQAIDSLSQAMKNIESDTLAFGRLESQVRVLFPQLKEFGFGRQMLQTAFESNTDTLPVAVVKWDPNMRSSLRRAEQKKLQAWLETYLELKSIKVIRDF